MDKSVCQKLVKCLLNTAEHDVAEGVLNLIAVLAEHDRYVSDMFEAFISKKLERITTGKCTEVMYSNGNVLMFFANILDIS